jgi:hypothetical protein
LKVEVQIPEEQEHRDKSLSQDVDSMGSAADAFLDDHLGSPRSLVSSHNQKRFRRTKGEIARKYLCWCGKAYGSENSLNQHKKLKSHFDANSIPEKDMEQATKDRQDLEMLERMQENVNQGDGATRDIMDTFK